MMVRFETEVEQLTGRTRPMGVKEILIERATNKGLAIGREKGLSQGISQGEHNKAVEMASQMLIEKEPLDKIARYTKLTMEEIKNL